MTFITVYISILAVLSMSFFSTVSARVNYDGTQNIGFRTTVTQKGFDEVKVTLLEIINSKFAHLTIPDIHTDAHVIEPIGHITIDLTNITIDNLHLGNAVISTKTPNILSATISGVVLDLKLNYKWRKVHSPHMSDHGVVTAKPKSGAISLSLSVSTVSGHPHTSMISDACDFDDWDIHFDGKVDWLYNLLINLFKSTITQAIDKAVADELSTVVDTTLNTMFDSIPTSISIGGGKSRVDINVSFVNISAGVEKNTSYFTMSDSFEVRNNKTGQVCAIVPKLLPIVNTTGNALQIFFSDATINCAIWVSFTNGALYVDFPSNTSSWKVFIPQIPKKYGPDIPMLLSFTPLIAPKIVVNSTGVVGNMDYNMTMYVVNGTEHVYLCTLGLEFNFGVIVGITSNKTSSVLHGNITNLVLAIKVVHSGIGPIDPVGLKLIAKLIGPVAEKLLNEFLANGFPLPLGHGLQLINPVIQERLGYLEIGADIKYTPQKYT